MCLLGVPGQQAHKQQRQEVQARGDGEDQFRGGEVGVDGRLPGPGEEHRAEGGDADGARELLDGIERARAGTDFSGGGITKDEIDKRDEHQPGAETGQQERGFTRG